MEKGGTFVSFSTACPIVHLQMSCSSTIVDKGEKDGLGEGMSKMVCLSSFMR